MYIVTQQSSADHDAVGRSRMNWNEVKQLLDEGEYARIVDQGLLNRTPWIFGTDKRYEDWKAFIGSVLGGPAIEMRIVGSAATGFTLSPLKPLGQKFRPLLAAGDQTSDIDIALLDSALFISSWDSLVAQDRGSGLGSPDDAQYLRLSVYRGFVGFSNIPRGTDAARRILNLKGALSRSEGLRGYPLRFRIYRRLEDLRAYHLWSLKKLKQKTSEEL